MLSDSREFRPFFVEGLQIPGGRVKYGLAPACRRFTILSEVAYAY